MEPAFGHLATSRLVIKSAFWDYWETAVFAQILTGNLLELDFGHLTTSRPVIKSTFSFLSKSWPGILLELDFGYLTASRPAIKSAFWNYWEMAIFGQILTGSILELDFGHLAASRLAIKSAFWNYWETAVFWPNPGREPFGTRFWLFNCFPAGN